MSAKRYFFWDENKQAVQGPGKLPVLAVLYKQKSITDETPVCLENTEDWFPLKQLPEFGMLPELAPEGARIVMPGEETDQDIENREARKEFALKAVVALGIALVGAFAVMLLAALDPGMFAILLIACLGLSVLGKAMIVVNAMDDGWLWVAGVILVPFVDIAYGLMNPKAINWVLLCYIAYFMIFGVLIAGVVGEVIRQSSAMGMLG